MQRRGQAKGKCATGQLSQSLRSLSEKGEKGGKGKPTQR